MELSIHLVTWNGERYIPHLFDSLRKQTNKNWHLIILDNGSTDKTVSLMEEEIKTLGASCSVAKNATNKGYASGYNTLFQKSNAEYAFIINQDMVLEPHCIERLMSYANMHHDTGVIVPRIMKWDVQRNHRSDTVDAIGLRVFRSRRVVEQYANETWAELHKKIHTRNHDVDVFGPSAAAALFRGDIYKHLLLPKNQFFDESYGSYKEDVDLAYRLRSAGYKTKALLSAVVYHDRSSGVQASLRDVDAAKNKKKQPDYVRYQSYKNHITTLLKNEYWQNTILDLPWILWYELKKFAWLLLFDRRVLRGLLDVVSLRVSISVSRKIIRKERTVSWKHMREFWRNV